LDRVAGPRFWKGGGRARRRHGLRRPVLQDPARRPIRASRSLVRHPRRFRSRPAATSATWKKGAVGTVKRDPAVAGTAPAATGPSLWVGVSTTASRTFCGSRRPAAATMGTDRRLHRTTSRLSRQCPAARTGPRQRADRAAEPMIPRARWPRLLLPSGSASGEPTKRPDDTPSPVLVEPCVDSPRLRRRIPARRPERVGRSPACLPRRHVRDPLKVLWGAAGMFIGDR